ncbi:MAG: tetratricopeptide repeat protein [Proteobacteria bacterium]|nr:tetratricopeptide repeat protein [Pseudomonadota bacterium]
MKKIKFILLIAVVFQFSNVFAGELKTGNPERKRSSNEAMSEMVYKKFVKYQEMMADSKYAEARAGLTALAAKKLNGFETANVYQYLGYIDAAEGKYVAAVSGFQKAIDSDALPNQAHFNMMLQIAQMLLGDGKHQQGLAALQKYYKVTDAIKDTTFAMEANAYAQMNQYRKAIPILKKAIDLADKPKEQWQYLLYSLHMELSQFSQAAKVLEALIAINPNKKDYWKRLSAVYFNLKKDDKSLATLVVAEKNSLLTNEKDILQLSKMYALLEVPYKAAQVLEQGLKSGVIKPAFKRWENLGKLWYSAAEMDKALFAYDKASELASDGKIDFQRAHIYFGREDWSKASNALRAAIEKGGLTDKKVGTGYLLIGMAESEQGNTNAAIQALKRALKYTSVKKHAIQWLDHIEEQAKRAKADAEREKILADAEVVAETTE